MHREQEYFQRKPFYLIAPRGVAGDVDIDDVLEVVLCCYEVFQRGKISFGLIIDQGGIILRIHGLGGVG